jgi:hypothetical protein
LAKLRNPRAVRLVFLIFRFRDSVGPLKTSGWAKCARNSDESPLLSPPWVLESGLFDPDSVDLAGHLVAQRGVAVSVVVFVFEVADDHAGLEQGVPVVAVETLLA